MDGVLVVDKPVGPTSHDIVARVRRALGERRVGHAGTLDPGASGVLVLMIGRATRLAPFLSAETKTYDAVVQLGVSTNTYDGAGRPNGPAYSGPWPTRDIVEATLEEFRGTQLQSPPPYSAKKIGGHRSYDLARRHERHGGEAVAPLAVQVSTERVRMTSYADGVVGLDVVCSAGFYVRTLAHDVGERLGTGAHLAALRRTRSGTFTLTQARELASVECSRQAAEAGVTPMSHLLPALPAVTLTAGGTTLASHGRDLGPHDCVPGADCERVFSPDAPLHPAVRLLTASGDLLAIARAVRPGALHPSVVLK